jgi:hypothetical protein
MKKLVILLLLAGIGCGVPSKTPVATPVTPVPGLPSVAGNWDGSMVFTTATGNLMFTLTQDASGALSGTASSVPPSCEFSLQVTGTVYSNGSFFLQTADTTLSLSGKIGNNNQTLTGNVQLGDNTGCGPRTGTFDVQVQ